VTAPTDESQAVEFSEVECLWDTNFEGKPHDLYVCLRKKVLFGTLTFASCSGVSCDKPDPMPPENNNMYMPREIFGVRYETEGGFKCLPGFRYMDTPYEDWYNVTCKRPTTAAEEPGFYAPVPDYTNKFCVKSEQQPVLILQIDQYLAVECDPDDLPDAPVNGRSWRDLTSKIPGESQVLEREIIAKIPLSVETISDGSWTVSSDNSVNSGGEALVVDRATFRSVLSGNDTTPFRLTPATGEEVTLKLVLGVPYMVSAVSLYATKDFQVSISMGFLQ